MRSIKIAAAVALSALGLTTFAACGGSSHSEATPVTDETLVDETYAWHADSLSMSVYEQYVKDFPALEDVGCIHEEGNNWKCVLTFPPGHRYYNNNNLEVTVDDVEGSWISSSY